VSQRNDNLRVGVFLVVMLAILISVVFLLGQREALFSQRATLLVELDDIGGLAEGAAVRLAGLEIGYVKRIKLSDDQQTKKLVVSMSIDSTYLERIREDSEIAVTSTGLLGDKLINIGIGSIDSPAVQSGGKLTNIQQSDLDKFVKRAASLLDDIDRLVNNVDTVVTETFNPKVRADVERIMNATANMLKEIETGDGTLHNLIYDKKYGDKLARLMDELTETSEAIKLAARDLRGPIDKVDTILADIRKGPGTAHSLIDGPEGRDMIVEIKDAAAQVNAILKEVREGNGLVHGLIYGTGDTDFMTSLTQLSNRLNNVVGRIERGEGTIGGLIQDPTVYEDLKATVGSIRRSWTFRTLVRFAIKKDDIARPPALSAEGPTRFYSDIPVSPTPLTPAK